jgi:hypothetical protein
MSSEEILRGLASHKGWLELFRGGPYAVEPGDPCKWDIEIALGLRSTRPRTEPPPAVDLPSVGALVGVTRTRFLEALGHPACGRWASEPGTQHYERLPCEEARELEYSFYYLPDNYVGGGPELIVEFDERGVCNSARWMRSQ